MISKFTFSVVICVYKNDDPYKFNLSLRSIFRNSLKPKEIILVIDGPIKISLQNIIDKYKDHLKVIYIDKNVGLANAFNLGVKYSNCDYIIKQDSDDFSNKNRFSMLIETMMKGVDICGSFMQERYENYKVIKKVPTNFDHMKKIIKYRNIINNPTVCIKKTFTSWGVSRYKI